MKTDSHRAKWRSLARKSDFQLVYEQGAKRVGRLVVVYLLMPTADQVPAGYRDRFDLARAVVASKKVGGAVARNRAKRLLREAHRLGILGQWKCPDTEQTQKSTTSAGLWVVLVARQRILSASSREVREELDKLLKAEPQLQ